MPYIKKNRRAALTIDKAVPDTAGELNFCFTTKALEYLNTHGLSYATINDIMGAFEGAKVEFYRRVAVPYEDQKIKENGDVYNDPDD